METPLTEPVFSEQLLVLQAKLALTGEQHQRSSRAAQACFLLLFDVQSDMFMVFQDVVGVLAALRIKAVERIRHFLLSKLQQLKRPLANYQLPQNALLKHK